MSWLLHLYKTYEANLDQVGKTVKKGNDREYTLLPISHTTQNAHIEVTINEDGDFQKAEILDKENTLIPCTEESASRAGSKIAPYPLHDKLSYVAGDFVKYGGQIKNPDEVPFDTYIRNLEEWAHSPSATEKLKCIYTYLRKGRLIEDLVNAEKLVLDKDQQLIEKWDKKYEKLFSEKPRIFSNGITEQSSVFVRFNVFFPESLADVWKDKAMHDSFIAFYNQKLGGKDVCFVTGDTLPSTERHANKIRHAADKAKIISANDNSGFTFRGRFKTSKQAVGISYEVSQKAHNALKWLIHRQGKTIDNRVFLVWGNDNNPVPNPNEDIVDLMRHLDREPEREPDTDKPFADQVSKAIAGYRNDLTYQAEVNILVLDSATTGRMAVLYYRQLNKELYLERLEKWHESCAWEHRYRSISFYGAPSTTDIAIAAYGPRADEKVKKGLMERMLPCIVDNRPVPKDIVRSVIQRASNPVSMKQWEWKKTLSIACSLIKNQEGIAMSLNLESNDRNYLFGRLLGVAYVIERWALSELKDDRITNAERYMMSFSNKPLRTWKTIHNSLQPYKARLGKKVDNYYKLIITITDQFEFGKFNDENLSGLFLAGFSSQVLALDHTKKRQLEDKIIEEEETNKNENS